MAMNIDLLELRHSAFVHLSSAADATVLAITNISVLDAGCGILGGAALLGAYEWHRRWVKGKGYRMAVEQERQRVNTLLSDGITDLILTWETTGKISNQQGDKLYAELGRKLGLPDLIPTKRRAKIIKNEIKSRMRSPEHQVKKPTIPGKPEPIVRKKFRQTAGQSTPEVLEDRLICFHRGSFVAKPHNEEEDMNSIGKQTIVTVLAGQQAPVEVLKLLLDKKPKQFGFTIQGKEGDDPELSSLRTEEIPTLENLLELNTNAKAFHLHMTFGYIDGKMDDKNIQPFLLTDGNDTPYMSFVIEGVFSKFSDPAECTEELNVFNKIIYPDIENILELTDGNINKLKQHLSGDRFNETFLSNTDHRGVLHILPLEGDPISLGKNELGEVYDWGSMSQKHGYGDVVQEPELKKVETNKAGWWKKKEGKADAKAEAKTDTKASVPEVKAKKDDKTIQAVRPPAWCHSNNDMRAWYMAVHGSVVANWKKRIPVTRTNDTPDWKDLKEFSLWVTKQKATAPAETSSVAKVDASTTNVKKIEAKVEQGLGTLLNKKELEAALDYVSKHLDGQSQEIPDPKTIQSMEKKVPTLSETLAFDAESYLNWPKAALFKFFAEHPTAAALAFVEVRDMLRPHVKVKAKAPETKVVTTTEKSGEGTTKVESVVVPTKTEDKKGVWWKKKAAA